MEDEYKLVMPFFDESHSFAHGIECGMIWQMMKYGEAIDRVVHKENRKQLEPICETLNYNSEFTDHDDTWIFMKAAPNKIEASQAPKQ